jgi:hypothetical protein
MAPSLRSWLCSLGGVALQAVAVCAAGDMASTILVLAKTQYAADQATSGLQGYGIPYEVVIVPQTGVTLPPLNTTNKGNYAGILTMAELSYEYPTGWASALTAAQWQQMYAYQSEFGARMVRIDVFPGPDYGTTLATGAGCCASGQEQLVKITDDSTFKTANIKTNQGVSTVGLWHVPATITNANTTKAFAMFDPSGSFTTQTVAGVINTYGNRQQMVWFMSWATEWALGSSFLQHASIHFLTRGLHVGARQIFISAQVDDVFLSTGLYEPAGTTFRTRPADMAAHVTWTQNLNSRLPAGSDFFVELAHNGLGGIIYSHIADLKATGQACGPFTTPLINSPETTPLEWVKPLGTGDEYWSPDITTYNWTAACTKLDELSEWFQTPANRDAFAHMSHTFTHLSLNNVTYKDAAREIDFNRKWMAQLDLDKATRYSTAGLVPPAITGLHNGDVIKAWLDNGIKYVVGDNTRPPLRNRNSAWWPRITTVADDGYAGLVTIPRWSTAIYYNCDLPECNLNEWIKTSAGSGDFYNLLRDSRNRNVNYLLGLHPDPYMFHQANMRQTDAPSLTIGTQTGRMSLLQAWVETIAQEMTRLTNWPILSLKHDDIGQLFLDRMARE